MTVRVVQFATGTVGRQAMKLVLDRPELAYVGGYVTSEAKAGRDLGELAGRPPIGITATSSLAAICALEADVVLHMPLPSARAGDDPGHDEDVICALLESG